MLLPVESKIDWNKIISRKQNRIQKNNDRENSKRIDNNFQKEIGRHSHNRDPFIELWLTVICDHTKW